MNTQNQVTSVSQAVATFGHLCPRGATLSFEKFAARVRSTSPQAAEVISKTRGIIRRGLLGSHSASWEA